MLKYEDQINCSLIHIQCSNETFKRPSERLENYCSKSVKKNVKNVRLLWSKANYRGVAQKLL